MNERRWRADPRLVASLAILLSIAAIALEIVYAIGHFVMATVQQIPTP